MHLNLRPMVLLLAASACVVPPQAGAVGGADAGDNLFRTLRDARRSVEPVGPGLRALAAAVPERVCDVGAGLGYDRTQRRVRTVTTPLALSCRGTQPGSVGWVLAGDGYVRVSAPGQPAAKGLGDIVAGLSYFAAPGLVLSASVVVPTGGEVGSTSATQVLAVSKGFDLGDDWGAKAKFSVARTGGLPAGISPYGQKLTLGLSHAPSGAPATWGLGVSRSHRKGAKGRTELAADVNFSLTKELDASLSLGRGLTAGSRHTAVEFGVGRQF